MVSHALYIIVVLFVYQIMWKNSLWYMDHSDITSDNQYNIVIVIAR